MLQKAFTFAKAHVVPLAFLALAIAVILAVAFVTPPVNP